MRNIEIGSSTVPGLVSVITPFLNTRESFFLEAIESVTKQTYDNWELMLVDDGSEASLSNVARRISEEHPDRIKYLEHEEHRNLGISASRNLGLSVARGEYIAFLDADDVWDEQQLREQVELLQSNPEAGMVFGNTLYWASWPGSTQASKRDILYDLILPTPQLVAPPGMLTLYLRGKAITPCMTSVIIRHRVIQPDEGFEEEFTEHYEDQVFLAKAWANHPVYVVDRVWGKYRQHSESVTADGDDSAVAKAWRVRYLRWLAGYLTEKKLRNSPVWRALRLQLRMSKYEWLAFLIHAAREVRRLWNIRYRSILAKFSAA